MKKSLASCSPEPDWEHFQKIRLKQKAMEQINLDWISQRKKKTNKKTRHTLDWIFFILPWEKIAKTPSVFSWQTCTGVHAGNVLQAQLPKILLQAPVNFGVTFRPELSAGWRNLHSKQRDQGGKEKMVHFSSKEQNILSSLGPDVWVENKPAERKLLRVLLKTHHVNVVDFVIYL